MARRPAVNVPVRVHRVNPSHAATSGRAVGRPWSIQRASCRALKSSSSDDDERGVEEVGHARQGLAHESGAVVEQPRRRRVTRARHG